MSVFKRRTRIVSFRLSEEEYEVLKKTCLAHGAHSVSDYARSSTCRVIDTNHGSHSPRVEAEIENLSGKVNELQRELERLSQLVERT